MKSERRPPARARAKSSTGRARRSNDALSAETRQKLMRAGRKLFAAHGYSAVSGESISARAELTRGALHYQFEDKAGLFRAVVDELLTELLAVLAEETMRDLTDHDR